MEEEQTIIAAPQIRPEHIAQSRHYYECIYSYTHPIDVNDPEVRPPNFGAAVLVKVGSRLLAATAKHVARHNPQLMTVRRSLADRRTREFVRLSPLRTILHPSRDVAVMEFADNPDVILGRCSLEQIREDNPPHDPEFQSMAYPATWVVGFPSARILETATSRHLERTNFGSVPTRIEGDYIEMAYPEESYTPASDGSGLVRSTTAIAPFGFSGGGGWCIVETPQGKLAVPDLFVRLYLIQYGWSRERQVVQCQSIRVWLKLVFDNFPDLQGVLIERFAFLRA